MTKDEVNRLIKDILWNYEHVEQEPTSIFEHYLRELVEMARKK